MIIVILRFLVLFSLHSPISGTVIYVSDGDTFHLTTSEGEKLKVRVEGIDCPESTQDFGLEAKEFTMKQVLNKKVTIDVKEVDRYGRKIARVYYDGKDLSKELLKNGFAWHYKKYNQEEDLAKLETEAKQNKIGLWSKNNQVAPWDYRRSK